MSVDVWVPRAVAELPGGPELTLDPVPADLGSLVRELERRHPGLGERLNSSAVNAAVNGEVVLHGRDATPLRDGDRVEFLIMFAGG